MYNITANTVFTGKTQVFLPTCHSTNEYAHSLLEEHMPAEGTIIISPEQTKGKGQLGASWEAEKGKNLTFSLVMYPDFLSIHHKFYLNIVSSLAVRETLSFFLKRPLTVKWPNDIYLNDSKISGILIETKIRQNAFSSAIIGVGINVNQLIFSDKKAVSMVNVIGEAFSLDLVLSFFLEQFERYYLLLKADKKELLMLQYQAVLYKVGVNAAFLVQGSLVNGVIKGVSENGKLQVEILNELKSFDLKEISFSI